MNALKGERYLHTHAQNKDVHILSSDSDVRRVCGKERYSELLVRLKGLSGEFSLTVWGFGFRGFNLQGRRVPVLAPNSST